MARTAFHAPTVLEEETRRPPGACGDNLQSCSGSALVRRLNPTALAHLHTFLDLSGTFVFAISGAISGVKHRLDLFGVLVLSFVAATSGGILRDVVIGAAPPPAIDDWRYCAVSVLAGIITFCRCPAVDKLGGPLLIFDAAGLGLFCAAGTTKALTFGLSPLAAVLLGMLTGIGGGIARDVLMREVPAVFQGEIYALAALAGSTLVMAGSRLGWPPLTTTVAGALLCFGLRCIAIRRGWSLPVAPGAEPVAVAEASRPAATSRPTKRP